MRFILCPKFKLKKLNFNTNFLKKKRKLERGRRKKGDQNLSGFIVNINNSFQWIDRLMNSIVISASLSFPKVFKFKKQKKKKKERRNRRRMLRTSQRIRQPTQTTESSPEPKLVSSPQRFLKQKMNIREFERLKRREIDFHLRNRCDAIDGEIQQDLRGVIEARQLS